nr:alpha/beta hydrolase-fold protein [uncultured Actinoplanes sp.]
MRSPRIARLIADGTPRAVRSFWAETTAAGTPLVEPWDDGCVLVTFLWRGEAVRTRAWFGVDVELTRLPGTDLWQGSEVLPAGLLTIYCLLHGDVETLPAGPAVTGQAHLDPGNPHRVCFPGDPQEPDDPDYWASVLRLPHAPAEPWTGTRAGVTPGRLTLARVPSASFGGDRTVTVYRPAGTPVDGLPTLVVFDGYLAQTVMAVPTVLDNLLADGLIPPLTALFVHARAEHRDDELVPGSPMETFVAGELLGWARAELGAGDAVRHLVAGVSRGGLLAAHLGLRRPDLFGGVIAQSGSFWWPEPDRGRPGRLIREVPDPAPAGVRFYLDVGSRETMPGPGGAPTQLDANRAMRDALIARGHRVTYAEYCGGHDYVNWRRTFADGLLAVHGR